MIDRLLKNWKSTLTGGIIFATGIVGFALDWFTVAEASPFLLGLIFFLFKDHNNWKEDGKK